MKMLHNNVLLTEAEQSTTTAGGIILTGDIDKAVKPGIVLSVSERVHACNNRWSESGNHRC